MRTTRQAFTIIAVLLVLVWIAQAASAGVDCTNEEKYRDHPHCQGDTDPDPSSTTTTTSISARSCASDGFEAYATDGTVEFPAGGSDNWCDDIRNEPNGTEIRFDFSVTPADKPLRVGFVLGIRNSIPGDWCGGVWSLYDDAGIVVFENARGNAISPSSIGNDWYAILVIDEQFAQDGNCTSDGDLLWYDDDPNWVLSLGGGAGRPLKGSEAIVVTWTPWNQPAS